MKICRICKEEFEPNKFHPTQEICSNSECQHTRQLINQRNWRVKNPNYFRYKERKTIADKKRGEYFKIWRENHKGYFKKYRRMASELKEKTKVSFLDLKN